MRKLRITSSQVGWALLGYLCSVLLVHVVGNIVQSLFVLAALEHAGAEIPLNLRLQTLWHDINNQMIYARGVLLGFAVALPVAILVSWYLRWSKWWVCPLAGAVAIATMLAIVNANYFGMSFFAGIRGTFAYLSQLMVGALGGAVFAAISVR